MLGYGTQFAPDLDEENRIVDSPIDLKLKSDNVYIPTCKECGHEISVAVHDYSVKNFGKPLCMDCQRKAAKI